MNDIIQKTTAPIFILLIAYICYLLFFPFKTIDIYSQPIPTSQRSYEVGDIMKYNFTYCRYTKANARITRNILPLL